MDKKPPDGQTYAETSLRDALAYADSIVDTVREPLLVLDGQLRVETASRAFFEIFRVSRDETIGHFLYDLGNGQWNIPSLREVLEEVLTEGKSFQDFAVVHNFPTLGRRVMRLNARKLWREGNHKEQLLLAIEDITERQRLEDEMLSSNEDLQRFAHVAAHDLRTPLNVALNLLGLLRQRLEGRLGEDESKILRLALETMERLRILIQDILAFAELNNNLEREKNLVPIAESLNIARQNLVHHIVSSNAAISIGTLPDVLTDRTHLTMILQNLISNAIKYRGIDVPRIYIDAQQHRDHWQISVNDNGMGFDTKYAEQIFEPFKRLHGPNIAGSGIGLATCRRIVERFGGRIWAESTLGVGSTFHFTIPNRQ